MDGFCFFVYFFPGDIQWNDVVGWKSAEIRGPACQWKFRIDKTAVRCSHSLRHKISHNFTTHLLESFSTTTNSLSGIRLQVNESFLGDATRIISNAIQRHLPFFLIVPDEKDWSEMTPFYNRLLEKDQVGID